MTEKETNKPMGTGDGLSREVKSLWEKPVTKLYKLGYGFIDNNSFRCNIEGYDVKITEKQAKLNMFLGGMNTRVYKKDKVFFYDKDGIRSYFSTPSKVLERFKKAVEVTKEKEFRNRSPAQLETLDSMVASLEDQVKLLEA